MTMAAIGKSGNDDTMWLPGEICVVCTVDGGAGQADAYYDTLLDWLNGEITRYLDQSVSPSVRGPAHLHQALAQDLACAGLRSRFQGRRPVLAARAGNERNAPP